MVKCARVIVCMSALLLMAGMGWAQQEKPAEAPPAPVQTLELADGDCVVFLGDSITHQRLYTQYVEDFFYTRFPNKRITFHNAGVGGARAWDALQRFDEDVAAYKPKYVTVLLGMNDGGVQPFNQSLFDTYHRDMTELIEKIHGIGAIPILMTPTMYDSRAALAANRGDDAGREFYNAVLAYYGTWLREIAYRHGYGVVDMWSPLNNITLEQRKIDPNFTLIKDAVHPGADGQLVMGFAILSDMGLAKPLSAIQIDAQRDELKSKVNGGAISDLKRTDGGLSFTWTADALPFVVPEDAQLGAKLLRMGHRASRERFVVSGLPAGRYELLIDGTVVGTYPAARLAGGIELQRNAKTPQHQQALQVATLNKQRNEGPIGELRKEWLQFQTFARTRKIVADQPDNTTAANSLKELEGKIAGMEERVAKANADAKAIEDQIYEVNKPKAHAYELKRVEGQAKKESPKGAASVEGLVTLKGQPLAGARVVFQKDGSGKGRETTTGEDGKFAFAKIPLGNYRVGIASEVVTEKYADPNTSSLTVTVQEGRNQFNFELDQTASQ